MSRAARMAKLGDALATYGCDSAQYMLYVAPDFVIGNARNEQVPPRENGISLRIVYHLP